MKNEEISQKPVVQSNAGSEAYANLARTAWEKPAGAAATSAKAESFAPQPESGSAKVGTLTPKSGSSEEVGSGQKGQPGGGGGHRIEHNDGSKSSGSSHGEKAGSSNQGVDAQGSSAHEKAGAVDKNAPKADGAGELGKPSEKATVPGESKSGGEPRHSKPVEHKGKQDAAIQHLPSLSIV